MACCDEPLPEGAFRAEINYADLPAETFCCMGRMAHVLCAAAQESLLGTSAPAYASLTETEKFGLGIRVKAIILNEFLPVSDFDKLFERVVKTMVSNA